MSNTLITWDVYEISSSDASLNGVMLRGRLRKLGIEKNFNILAENTEDADNRVRFAVLNYDDAVLVTEYVKSVIKNVEIELKLNNVVNPVISKLKVNIESRYTL